MSLPVFAAFVKKNAGPGLTLENLATKYHCQKGGAKKSQKAGSKKSKKTVRK